MSRSLSLESPQGRWFVVVASLLSLPMAAVVSADTIVYDNTVNFGGFYNPSSGLEWGDGATLAGTERVVTKISLMIHSMSGDVTSDLTVRLFEGGDDWEAEPGAMLWESVLFQQMTIFDGSNLYDFDVPSVTVPASVTWTLELQNADPPGALFGSRFMGSPVVGSSEEFFWQHNTNGTWGREHLFRNNLGARIEAVPEPGTLTALALGAFGVGRYRR